MAELPSSWGLRTEKRTDGKLDVIGKTDNGHDYRVRTTDTNQITEKDVSELKAADRESYSNPNTRTRDYVKHLMANPAKEAAEAAFEDDLVDLAGPAVYAGMGRKGSHVGGGYSRTGETNFENWLKSMEEKN